MRTLNADPSRPAGWLFTQRSVRLRLLPQKPIAFMSQVTDDPQGNSRYNGTVVARAYSAKPYFPETSP